MKVSISSLLLGVFLIALFSQTLAHSYVTSPTSRSNQKESGTGCRGPACLGPCDRPKNSITRTSQTQRGASIKIDWPRNNHAGGFIRFAWAKTSDSDSHASFDDGVQQINCHEVGGCHPDDPSNPNGGDSGPSDGSSRACSSTLNVPSYLTDGQWTLQWAWFGGAFELGDYYSCVDYVVSGGSAVTVNKPAAIFKGGDYTYPNQQKCKFFNTDRLHRCVNEPCNNPVYTLSQERAGPAFNVSTTATPPPAAATTGKNTPTPPPAPVTTGKAHNTPSNPPTPSTPSSPPPVSEGACTLGYQRCVGTNYQTCGWASRTETGWSIVQPCPTGTACHQVQGNYIWCY